MDPFSLFKNKRQFHPVAIHIDTPFQPHMFLEVQLPPAIPFKNSLLGAPDQSKELLVYPAPKPPLLQEQRIVLVKKMSLFLRQEFLSHHLDTGRDLLDVHPYPAVAADDRRGIIPAMRNGKMIFFARQEGLPGIGDPDLFHRKIREKIG